MVRGITYMKIHLISTGGKNEQVSKQHGGRGRKAVYYHQLASGKAILYCNSLNHFLQADEGSYKYMHVI